MNATDIAAYGAVLGTAGGLIIQFGNLVRKRHIEKGEVKEALDRAPLVREQLWLGNVSGAVEQLNAIIESQAKHIKWQNDRIALQDRKIAEQDRRIQEQDNKIQILERMLRRKNGDYE